MLTSSLFIIGLCLGSFVTCMAERISNGHILISTQRSRCPHCRHQLRFWQLIPLLGILLQRGQCYDCRTPISLRSSLIELLCGSLLASSSASLSLTLPLLIGYLVLIFNSLTDYLTFEVYPLTLLLPAGLGLWQQRPPLTISLYLVLALLVGLYLLARLTATFGLGDVDLSRHCGRCRISWFYHQCPTPSLTIRALHQLELHHGHPTHGSRIASYNCNVLVRPIIAC